ncbi:Rec8 like protein-domain-containing protein [Pisolithus marmoratus]|nr:Rec8 like protein-domain-containing protein [Pisolithus marmoratus]
MFYSEAIFIASRVLWQKYGLRHTWNGNSPKTQTLQTDIEQAACAIMAPEVEVMALRLSGQLLLGVVRIYSRKAKYLLDDCNEALLKIKKAFRPGVVDMIEEQLAANRSAITLQGGNLDLDVLIPGINWWLSLRVITSPEKPTSHCRLADEFQLDLDNPGYRFDLGPSDGVGSQDFGELDLGRDFGDGPVSVVNGIVEVGRDAPIPWSARESLEWDGGPCVDRDVDMPFGPDIGGMDVDLGLDFGDGPLERAQKECEHDRRPGCVFLASALTEPPQTPLLDMQFTPRLAAETIPEKTLRAEPGGGRGFGAPVVQDVSDILTEQRFLPCSLTVMRLMEIREDPLAHFLPTKVTPEGTYLCVGPPGLAPRLTGLFLRPIQSGPLSKKRGTSPGKGSGKKPGWREDLGAERAKSLAPSELTRLSIARIEGEEETHADLTCPIAAFDIRPLPSSQSQETGGDRRPQRVQTEHPRDEFRQNVTKSITTGCVCVVFELLVLGTRDCIKLTQSAAFENIKIQAKPKLWEQGGSVASAMSLSSLQKNSLYMWFYDAVIDQKMEEEKVKLMRRYFQPQTLWGMEENISLI